MYKRTLGGAAAALVCAIGLTLPAAASAPQVYTWTVNVDVEYFNCDTFVAHGVWSISHRLTVFLDKSGTPASDHDVVTFDGAFVNPVSGASIADSGRIIYFDTLDAGGKIVTTIQNFVRHSAYLHEAGRYDFQTGTFHGTSRFDAGIPAACAALGG